MRTLAHGTMTMLVVTHEMALHGRRRRVLFIDGGVIRRAGSAKAGITSPACAQAEFLRRVLLAFRSEF